ncbi:hypothetical protein DER29_3171 [Micromonospora sp. M71_S20]|uniref:hypothetical protein n=1 Tax=Micromonospora sp. M71_S20 TaxID=592872 RepID=UPI000F219828|nr:hypothetical protein [Micromonospora sp. M71_S20]RLK25185.1 hypothetical protein DER29_3171 [Micromonospora sp. M71_S20]
MESSDILAVVAIVTAVLSAIYSHRLSRRAHHVSTYYGVIGLFRELDKTFLEYPEIRPYFYDGKPVGDDEPDRHRIRAAAELILDTFEWIWYRRKDLNAKGEEGWRAYIVDTFSSSPALQHHYASSASWYPGITRLIAEHGIALADGMVSSGDVSVGGRRGRGRFDGAREGVSIEGAAND